MGARTDHPHGCFSWIDLATSDLPGAQRFYSRLFGWRFEDRALGRSGGSYAVAHLDDAPVAAAFTALPSVPAPTWRSHVSVRELAPLAERVPALGGQVLAGPRDLPEQGRSMSVRDPSGAVLHLWEPGADIGARRVNEPGCLCWNELNTRDTAAAKRFYRELLGWTFADFQAGPVTHSLIWNDGRLNGGVFDMREVVPEHVPPHWVVHVAVVDTDDCVKRALGLGATVLMPGTDIPDGRFALLRDPQGGSFAVIRRAVVDD